MVTISLCMIVKNEEEVLSNCLDSVKNIVDEMIIVDTGSNDRTKEIARQYTDKVYDFEWIDNFSLARNTSFQYASMDYILWLDADDVIMEHDQEQFLKLKETLSTDMDAVSMLYHIAFDEQNNPTFSYRRNRLVKRLNNFKWIGAVHEYLDVRGNIYKSDIAITHQKHKKTTNNKISNRNLLIYEKQVEKGIKFTPRDLFYYGNELREHGDYERAIQIYDQFLETNQGWIEDIIRAHINKAVCYRNLGIMENEIDTLLKTLEYGNPRPEVSCRLGDLYLEQQYYEKAILWYQLATLTDINSIQGFVNKNYITWYPYLQLCICHWHIGNKEMAYQYHLKAKELRPNDPIILKNDELFKSHNIK